MTYEKTTIAVLGLGAMGSRMARRLVDAGHSVRVWNRSPSAAEALVAAGATSATTPAAAAEGADFVLSMLFDDDASRAVWLNDGTGAIHGLRPGALAIESGTVTRDWVMELKASVAAKHAELIDAPVAGSRPQAEAGQLIFIVGGSEAALEKARPALAAMGHAVHHIGEIGSGATFKLAVNTMFAAQLASMAELLGFLGRSGIDQQAAAATFANFPVISPSLAGAAKMMAARATAPLFTIDLVTKDLTYSIAAAKALGLDLISAKTTRAVFQSAKDKGFGQENITALVKLFD